MAIPPLLQTAQNRLHQQLDSAVDRFHKQNDASEHLVDAQLKAEDQAFDAQTKALGLKRPSGLKRRSSGVRKALQDQNHQAEEGLKRGFQGVQEQAKREGRLPTAQELQQIAGDTGAAPYINQLKPLERTPQYQGQMYCGPTVMAMIGRARGFGEGLSDSQLIEQFARTGGTDQGGTSGNGMIAIGQQMGLQARSAQGADFRFIDGELAQGRPVVALGNYYALPQHAAAGQDSGHYILLQSRDAAGNYRATDPMTEKVTVLTPDMLRAYMQAHQGGGFALSFQ
ncbi:MAG TPA: C39 family peptidase [Myxococcales bacterium]|jgi:hypothetical protein|nr:C39 family peptidase [Myxococcales bacterium]